jgi:transketolase
MLDQKQLAHRAKQIRSHVVEMVTRSKNSHVGSALSTVDILTYLYEVRFKNNDAKYPDAKGRDRFLLSKGHACTALYATLAEKGYFPTALLEEYAKDGSPLMSHISSEVSGVEFSTGSLGHALPVGLGMAISAKHRGEGWGTYVLMSDGELDEGSNWEGFLMAGHLGLDNLFVIIDHNGIQALGDTKDVISLEPLVPKLESFGWDVVRVNGHDFTALNRAFEHFDAKNKKPKIIIADTVKGKGVSFMEGKLEWHYRAPTEELKEQALKEIEQNI